MQMLSHIKHYWFDFVGLLFPNLCAACGEPLNRSEQVVCLHCLADLPHTHFHRHADNPVAQRFWGRVQLEGATSLYYFTKGGKVQHMIHELKYNGRKEVGEFMGRQLGRQLVADKALTDIALIAPVPLHPKKEQQRGYNQSTCFAMGISEATGIPVVENLLERTVYTESQTHKSREDRWLNVKDVFEVTQPQLVAHKHVLLVDDVMTTGATLEACAARLLDSGSTRVSVATIAMAE